MPLQHRGYLDADTRVALDLPCSITDAVVKGECRLGKAEHR